MKALSRTELTNLIGHQGPAVSIYLSGHKAENGPGIKQDKIQFKNLIRTTRDQILVNFPDKIDALYRPLEDLLNDEAFWQEQSPGLAIFSAEGQLHHYRVPINFNGGDLAIVTENFHIKPLLPLFTSEAKFWILTLSRDYIRLFKVEDHTIRDVVLPAAVPTNIQQMLQFETPINNAHFDSGRPESNDRRGQGAGGSYDPTYHGGEVDEKDDVMRFFYMIDKGLHEILANQHVPLVLAGVEYLLPLYQQANTYPHIVDVGITGNPELLSRQELHERGWQIVAPIMLQGLANAKERYQELLTKEMASNRLSEVIKAAVYGQVETLFITPHLQQWGSFDASTNRVELHDEAQPGDLELYNFAATQTMLKGGTVYAIDAAQMPLGDSIGAIYRFKANSAVGGA